MERTLTISVGDSKRCTHWVPKETTWERLCNKLRHPQITDETVTEYAEMSKNQRDGIKDVGGYVGGRTENGSRRADAIRDRQIVCLDADYGDLGLWDTWELMIGKACLMHSSHSHTPEKPRLRFVIPLSRPVTAEEYEPIARRLAEWMDMNAFDDTTYEANRLMFWPSVSKDGEYVCEICDTDDWVNPDEVLATYEDWRDMRTWPTSDRQRQSITTQGTVQGDPLTKPGVIGAFNRAYTITEAIDAYLSGVYIPCGDNRWTYAKGSTTGGAVTYNNDTFIYSHHNTDPISRRLCSAFDMVRIHLFGEQDEGSEASIGELPSMGAMKAMLKNDPKVCAELSEAALTDPNVIFDEKVDLQRFTGDFTEQGLAIGFADMYCENLRYNKALGWMFWDGVRWVLDAEAEASMLIMKYADDFYMAARNHWTLAADKAEQAVAKSELMAATKLRSATGIGHLIALTKTLVNENYPQSYDAEAWDLNTPDGIIDLRTGALRPHDRKAKCTKCTAVSPGETGKAQWLEFINHVTGGDEAFARYLQTLAGMAAVGAVYEEGLVISYGKGGNGKSTLFGALGTVLGDYSKTINSEVIITAYNRQADASYVAALRGARLVVLGETEESAVLSVAQMKKITSQDVISARSLYKDPIEFKPTHTTIMHTNHLPRIGSMDDGTKRRIAVAPFPATLPPERVIKNYQSVLVRECGPAILQWIVEGAVMFYSDRCNLPKPECVERVTQQYVRSEDWVVSFLEDCCEVGEGKEVKANDLYIAYQSWANSQGVMRPKRARDFASALEGRGYSRRKTSAANVWDGIDLREKV